ncbi:MAG: 2,5-furandicarboxylate decarboxylase 1, partial [Candidatus Eremiobacteraeota bacterium]|nr:2,5-furandicarboxylate decarboxylase 1 [Candidatus Eremiobacteraeota bacterium]
MTMLETSWAAGTRRAARSLRTWLDDLQAAGKLDVVDKTVDLRYELAAIAKRLDGRAVVFTSVAGHAMPVVSGIVSTRAMIAGACGCDERELVRRFAAAVAQPLATAAAAREDAPCKQNVVRGDIDLMRLLPLPVHHEHDAGKYVTAGLFIVRDPVTRKQNVSIHRLQLTGPNRFGALILPRHTHHLQAAAERRGEPLECAIVIGVDPATLLASQASTPFGVDELEIAGALRGEPVRVVRCETVDIDVPAFAEIVLEGSILPGVREPEGPFGEFPKYYGPRSDKEVVEVRAITHRDDPLFYTIVPAGMEHLLLGAVPREASLLETVRQTVPTVRDVRMSVGGTCRYHAVVQIDKREEGQGKNAILAAFANSFDIKHVTVVDPDVDISDPNEVEWALATRFQADRDLVVVTGAQGSKLDPSTDDGLGAKTGFDCTIPLGADPFRYLRVRIPGEENVNVAALARPRVG